MDLQHKPHLLPAHNAQRSRLQEFLCCPLSFHFNYLIIRANKTGFVIAFLYLSMIFTAATATAQTQDQDPKTGTYAGASFASSQIESVNITNGNLMVNLPLVSLPAGRNGLSAGVSVNYK